MSEDSDMEKGEDLHESEKTGDTLNMESGLSAYELLRIERIKRNTEKLMSLGLIRRTSSSQPSTPSLPVVRRKPTNQPNRRVSSVPPTTRKSPRLQSQVIDLSSERTSTSASQAALSSLRRSPRLINSAQQEQEEEGLSPNQNERTSSSGGQSVSRTVDGSVVLSTQRPYAKTAVSVGKARRNLLVASEGDRVLHPMTVSSLNVKESKLPEESKDSFITMCDAFVRYHADLGSCYHYSNRKYQTRCSCLNSLLLGTNTEDKFSQLTQAMYSFFVRPRNTQKLVFKEWIRAATVIKTVKKVSCYKVGTIFAVSGVYNDAPDNKKLFFACQNSLMRIFNYGYFKYIKLKKDIENPSVAPHGLCNRLSNNMLNNQVKYNTINDSLKTFFEDLKEQAETHATRVIREVSGSALRADEVDTVELPSSMTKRQLYGQYCYKRGWVVRADAKGKLPKLKDYPVRKFDDHWPVGSVPKPVPSRIYFDMYWQKNYPKMKIRPPSADT